MASLHVGDVPDALHERIRKLAEANGRALGAEVVTLLERAVRAEDARVRNREALDWMRRNRHVYPPGKKVPDSVELLREDRAR